MTFDPEKHRRRSIRLRGHDYSQEGAYFITICAQDRRCLFGEIADGEMRLNDAGWMLSVVWRQIPDCYPGAAVDEYVIMPNHIHGIILLIHDTSVGAGPCACPSEGPCACPDTGQPRGVAPTKISLGDVIGRLKCLTSRKYIAGIRKHGWPPFAGRLWQRNYYEHIIRNDDDLTEIREYIIANPSKWSEDREYTPL